MRAKGLCFTSVTKTPETRENCKLFNSILKKGKGLITMRNSVSSRKL